MKTRRSSAAAVLEFTAREREEERERVKMQCEEMLRRRGMRGWNGSERMRGRRRGFEAKGKREERQLNQMGWSFLPPAPLHTITHTHWHTHMDTHTHGHTHLLSQLASGSHGACTLAGRQAGGDQSCSGTSVCMCVSAMCSRHADGGLCHASGGAMLAGVEGAVCVCACVHC